MIAQSKLDEAFVVEVAYNVPNSSRSEHSLTVSRTIESLSDSGVVSYCPGVVDE